MPAQRPAREGADETGDVLLLLRRDPRLHSKPPLQSKGRHLQTRDPAFGAGFEGGYVVGGEIQAHTSVEESGRFVGSEAQVGLAQFSQLALPAQSCDRQGRVDAGGDGQVHPWRQELAPTPALDFRMRGPCSVSSTSYPEVSI